MSLVHQRFWSLGQWLVSLGFIASLVLAGWGSVQQPRDPELLEPAASIAAVAILVGALILWFYAFRFYFKIQTTLGVTRSAWYLLVVICLNWVAPVVFMIVEGKDRFFEVALE